MNVLLCFISWCQIVNIRKSQPPETYPSVNFNELEVLTAKVRKPGVYSVFFFSILMFCSFERRDAFRSGRKITLLHFITCVPQLFAWNIKGRRSSFPDGQT